MIDAYLFLYDNNWQFKKRIALAENADPNDMIVFDGSLLIADIRLGHIYQFNSASSSPQIHSIENISNYLIYLNDNRAKYELIKYATMLLLALFIITFIVMTIRLNKKSKKFY